MLARKKKTTFLSQAQKPLCLVISYVRDLHADNYLVRFRNDLLRGASDCHELRFSGRCQRVVMLNGRQRLTSSKSNCNESKRNEIVDRLTASLSYREAPSVKSKTSFGR